MGLLTRANFVQPQSLTTVERDALTLGLVDEGLTIFNRTVQLLQVWNGTQWKDASTTPLDGSLLTGTVNGGIY